MCPKKVVILAGGIPPSSCGGSEIAALAIAEHAVKLGIDVHMIIPSTNYVAYDLHGVTIHPIRTLPRGYARAITYIPEAVTLIQKLKPDLVHAQSAYLTPSALIARWMYRIPYLLYERGGIYLKWAFNRPMYGLLTRFASRIICQTEHQKRAMQKYTSKPIEVIPNGVDAERFGKLTKTDARTRLGLPRDKQIVLSVGRCRPEKNLVQFVRAAMCDTHDRLYVLVGDGPQLTVLKAMPVGNILFVGAVPNDDIPTYMAAADVLVNTSHVEGFPVAVLEGMAAGLPIVATDVCGMSEIITEGINGFLTLPNDHLETAAAIDWLLLERQRVSPIGAANCNKVLQYTWDNVVRRLYE